MAGVILVYDISKASTFRNCLDWLQQLEAAAKQKPVSILVGNKKDLVSQREVTTQMGQDFANQHGLLFMETSAKSENGNAVPQVFSTLGHQIYHNIQSFKIQPGTEGSGVKRGFYVLYQEQHGQKKSGCCFS